MFCSRKKTIKIDQAQGHSFWHDVGVRFWKNRMAKLGMILLALIILSCLYGLFFIDYEKDVIEMQVAIKCQPPSWEHPFGTDGFGRDILARILYGSRYSLIIGFAATIGSLMVGALIGCVAGYFGGAIDNILMRTMDVFIAIPSTLMAIAVVSALGANMVNLIIAILIGDVPGYARVVRSAVLSVKDNEFVEASVAVGGSHAHIITTHIFPNTLAVLIVQATLGVGYDIIAASGLSYLGLGVMPPDPEWGAMLSESQTYIRYSPHMVIFPGLAIVITVLALNLLGDALRDAVDPTLKN